MTPRFLRVIDAFSASLPDPFWTNDERVLLVGDIRFEIAFTDGTNRWRISDSEGGISGSEFPEMIATKSDLRQYLARSARGG